MSGEWLTSKGLAEYLGGMSVDTIANWRHIGIGPPYVKFGGAVRYSRAAVDQWVAAGGDRAPARATAPRPAQRHR